MLLQVNCAIILSPRRLDVDAELQKQLDAALAAEDTEHVILTVAPHDVPPPIIGPAGTGKSHTLIGLGVAAIHAGHKVRYFTAANDPPFAAESRVSTGPTALAYPAAPLPKS
jgi:hypothetical protein